MSFNPNNQTINAPVSVYDVQKALSTSENDVGRLCRHDNINMWARNKPVRFETVKVLTDAQRMQTRFGLGFPGLGGNIYFNKFIHDVMNGDAVAWEYLRPRGDRTNILEPGGNYGVKEWYRLSDFDGYKHDAVPPIHTAIQNIDQLPYHRENNTYEINTSEIGSLAFVVYQDAAANIRMSEILQNVNNYRMMIEVYGDGQVGGLPWYSPGRNPSRSVVSDAIVGNNTVTAYLQTGGLSGIYHVCVGMQQCDDANRTNPISQTSFIAPRTKAEEATGKYPYYYKLWFVSYYSGKITFNAVGYARTGNFTFDGVYWTANYNGGEMFVDMHITRGNSKLYFANATQSIPSDGQRIMIGFTLTTPEDVVIATPANANRGAAAGGYITIPAASSSGDTQRIYATAPILPPWETAEDKYFAIRVLVKIGDNTWDNAGTLNMHYSSNS